MGTKATTIRLDDSVLARVDEISRARAKRSRFDSEPDRADTIRGLLLFALGEAEKEFGVQAVRVGTPAAVNTNASTARPVSNVHTSAAPQRKAAVPTRANAPAADPAHEDLRHRVIEALVGVSMQRCADGLNAKPTQTAEDICDFLGDIATGRLPKKLQAELGVLEEGEGG